MNGIPVVVLGLLTGFGLGLFYFGGLWLTVRRLADTTRPVLLFASSFVVRTALTVGGFYLLMNGSWERVLIALLGFLIARQFMIARLRPAAESHQESEAAQA